MDAATDSSEHIETSYKYAWDWFSYHAGQRLTTFRFFLIVVGALLVGYFNSLEKGWRWIGVMTALYGLVMSVAFWLLEIRNEELVRCGRRALDDLEKKLGQKIRKSDEDRTYLGDSLGPISGRIPEKWRPTLAKHRFWLRAIHLITGIGFLFALIYACLFVDP
jgi:hypothetical protein